MPASQQIRFQQLLQQLFTSVQNSDPLALQKILTLLEKNPKEPNLLHLAGLASLNTGDYQRAVDYLTRSLDSHSQQPDVQNNLANAFKELGDLESAETQYKSAITLNPQYQEAWKNLGLLQISMELHDEAEDSLRRAISLSPRDVGALTALGNIYKEQEAFEKAITTYQQALQIDPNYVNALHNMGLAYKLLEKADEAIACYQRAQEIAPGVAEIDFNYGNALYESGQHEQAERLYLSAIRKNPHFELAHETLSEFYWQSGEPDKIENSYREAIKSSPGHTGLRLSFINMLIAVNRHSTAQSIVEDSLKQEITPELLHAQGRLFANEMDYDNARSTMEKALQKSFSLDIAQDLIRLYILIGNYHQALDLLVKAQLLKPEDQLNWALKGLCWRLLEDDRYHWLIDYQAYVRGYTLPTPQGYANLADFMEELKSVLLGMHTTDLEPSRQTLKHGTQTPGRLLHKPHPVIQSYKASLTEAVQEYISTFPQDDAHPLLRRKSEDFSFSGSWSVKLKSSGFHINHVHPEGWISSACYISLPETMSLEHRSIENRSAEDGDSGCIKFGESPLGLGEREVIERVIRPEPGLMAFFPSYTWHGTFDFECDEGDYRMTAPFDVVPV